MPGSDVGRGLVARHGGGSELARSGVWLFEGRGWSPGGPPADGPRGAEIRGATDVVCHPHVTRRSKAPPRASVHERQGARAPGVRAQDAGGPLRPPVGRRAHAHVVRVRRRGTSVGARGAMTALPADVQRITWAAEQLGSASRRHIASPRRASCPGPSRSAGSGESACPGSFARSTAMRSRREPQEGGMPLGGVVRDLCPRHSGSGSARTLPRVAAISRSRCSRAWL